VQLLDGHIVLAPSDLTGHLACEHLTQLKLQKMRGELFLPPRDNPHAELLARRGDEHEAAYRASLGSEVVAIDFPRGGVEELREAEERTAAAMRAGAPFIFQASFFDGRWRGHADFLRRIDRASDLGPWSYEVLDTKLARAIKPAHAHQLCSYSAHVARLQGLMPERAYVILGDRAEVEVDVQALLPLHRHARRRLEQVVDGGAAATYPEPVTHCAICDFNRLCDRRRREDDHLSLVAGIRRDQREKLVALDLPTVRRLGEADAGHDPGALHDAPFRLLRTQAELQVRTRDTRTLQRRHLQPERRRGYARLPPPDDGDVFFDLEGDPFLGESGGVEYLWGWEELGPIGEWTYVERWAHDEAAEKREFEAFVDYVTARRLAHPRMHVYHYAAHEAATLRRLAAQHATRESEVDQLLRDEVLVDLFKAVRQGLQVGQESYSIKSMEPFYMPPRDKTIRTAGGSIVAYETWLATGDGTILEEIRDYNRDDCVSNRLLRDWLLGLRDEAAVEFGVDFAGLAIPEPEEPRPEPEWVAEIEALIEALGDAPDEERELLAWLLMYHRREGRPQWWTHFDLCAKSSFELIAESDAIGGLQPDAGAPVVRIKKSQGWWLTFPPQEHRLKLGDVVDPQTGKKGGEIVEFDGDSRLLLKRGASLADAPLPTGLIGPPPLLTREQRMALARVARSVLAGTGEFAAVRSILRRELPRVDGVAPGARLQGETISVEETVARALGVRDSHLVIQGPPGSGKTYRGARIVVEAIRAGRRVAIAATSHKAIHNLLAEVEKVASEERVELRGFHKSSDPESEFPSATGAIESANDNDRALDPELDVVSGTPWLLARGEQVGAFDLLVIDEAGQMSLADAAAIGGCARSIVALGDPQQLPQVTQASHPGSSGCSVLEHLLEGAATIPPQRGLFLAETRRLHPGVCDFISEAFYDGRLVPIAECADQRIVAGGRLTGAGLRHLAVEHSGRSQSAPEEVEAIAAACRDLLAGGRVLRAGADRALAAADILVVAPYNLAVREIAARVPAGVRVGTVDRFQGQEAPVVFYAMTSSSGEDAPRGLDFLFNRNRLNVAISRAQCLAVLVASPRLLDAECRTVEQMEMVSAVCRLVEMAEVG
jgi:uncharacterized protein